jgi:hypothetical protein
MKITVKNPRRIVESAFVKEGASSFSVFINTRRNIVPLSFGYNCEGDGSFDVVYDASDNDGDLSTDQVIFVPENDAEKRWLGCMHFEQQSKGQLWIIFLPENVYR